MTWHNPLLLQTMLITDSGQVIAVKAMILVLVLSCKLPIVPSLQCSRLTMRFPHYVLAVLDLLSMIILAMLNAIYVLLITVDLGLLALPILLKR